jgi:hypothetical protein
LLILFSSEVVLGGGLEQGLGSVGVGHVRSIAVLS